MKIKTAIMSIAQAMHPMAKNTRHRGVIQQKTTLCPKRITKLPKYTMEMAKLKSYDAAEASSLIPYFALTVVLHPEECSIAAEHRESHEEG
eukprot:CAMPEP_0198572478 /NCGR_PEP_ID=MMETSP1462-20131121/111878_1 /TAXON_ID=1333877 /ORGANISM="Brandtodinium nutriculum, Strain RCC3387" /LENGTH=90 /DNA_ID=CAMNT_0044303635 /DNA_START=21 /DNA_END=289 /DNA_ORIENTATION=-